MQITPFFFRDTASILLLNVVQTGCQTMAGPVTMQVRFLFMNLLMLLAIRLALHSTCLSSSENDIRPHLEAVSCKS